VVQCSHASITDGPPAREVCGFQRGGQAKDTPHDVLVDAVSGYFPLLNLIPNIPLTWRIAVLAVEAVFVIVFGRAVIRFSLWQRDEYWRERGRDPKHPERFPKGRQDGPDV
jgi:hypothetical protein